MRRVLWGDGYILSIQNILLFCTSSIPDGKQNGEWADKTTRSDSPFFSWIYPTFMADLRPRPETTAEIMGGARLPAARPRFDPEYLVDAFENQKWQRPGIRRAVTMAGNPEISVASLDDQILGHRAATDERQ